MVMSLLTKAHFSGTVYTGICCDAPLPFPISVHLSRDSAGGRAPCAAPALWGPWSLRPARPAATSGPCGKRRDKESLRFMGTQRVGHDWATDLNWLNWTTRRGGRLRCSDMLSGFADSSRRTSWEYSVGFLEISFLETSSCRSLDVSRELCLCWPPRLRAWSQSLGLLSLCSGLGVSVTPGPRHRPPRPSVGEASSAPRAAALAPPLALPLGPSDTRGRGGGQGQVP